MNQIYERYLWKVYVFENKVMFIVKGIFIDKNKNKVWLC